MSFGRFMGVLIISLTVYEIGVAKERRRLTVQKLDIRGQLNDVILTADIGNGTYTNFNVTIINRVLGDLYISCDVLSDIGGKYQSLTKVSDVDFCKFVTNFGKDPILKVVFYMVRQKTFIHGCPIEVGVYELKNIHFNPNVMPFRMMPFGKFLVKVEVYNQNSTHKSDSAFVETVILLDVENV